MKFGESLGLESRDDPRMENMTGTNVQLDWESSHGEMHLSVQLKARVRSTVVERAHQPREAVRKAS